MRGKVILKFHEKVDSLLVSGLLANWDELNNKPAVVDAPVGRGHVILFGIRPLWRWESQGSFALALNAIANWNHLDFQVAMRGPISGWVSGAHLQGPPAKATCPGLSMFDRRRGVHRARGH